MVPARNNWLAAGDPLRGIAASGVLLFHVATWAALTGTDPAHAPTFGVLGPVVHNLDAGVFLFFLLSGYLIGRPFASAFVMQTPFPRPSRFLARRALRLAPGALGATALALVLFGRGFRDGTLHFWTLGAEACFYATLPLTAALCLPLTRRLSRPRVRAALWITGCVSVGAASLWFRSRGTASDFGHQQVFPSVAFAFAPGLALAAVETIAAPRLRAAPVTSARAARVALLFAVLFGVAYFWVPRERFMDHSVLAVAAATWLFTAVLLRDWAGRPAWRALDNRPLQWLGERSYSLYVFHLPVVTFVARQLNPGDPVAIRVVVLALVSVPLSLALAWAGYAVIERPFLPRGPRQPPPDTAVLSRA